MAVKKVMKSWIAVLFFVLLVFTGCCNQTDPVGASEYVSPENVADTGGDITDKDIVSAEIQNGNEENGNETYKKKMKAVCSL